MPWYSTSVICAATAFAPWVGSLASVISMWSLRTAIGPFDVSITLWPYFSKLN